MDVSHSHFSIFNSIANPPYKLWTSDSHTHMWSKPNHCSKFQFTQFYRIQSSPFTGTCSMYTKWAQWRHRFPRLKCKNPSGLYRALTSAPLDNLWDEQEPQWHSRSFHSTSVSNVTNAQIFTARFSNLVISLPRRVDLIITGKGA